MKYVTAFEIASTLRKDMRPREHYRDDVLRNAALAAAETSTAEEAFVAIERAFQGARISINPRWDGSIA